MIDWVGYVLSRLDEEVQCCERKRAAAKLLQKKAERFVLWLCLKQNTQDSQMWLITIRGLEPFIDYVRLCILSIYIAASFRFDLCTCSIPLAIVCLDIGVLGQFQIQRLL